VADEDKTSPGDGNAASEHVALDPLDDFEETSFSHDGDTKTIYRMGDGPAVIVIAEIPGITPTVANFGRRIADLGCTAVMPVLFGEPGRSGTRGDGKPDLGYMFSVFPKLCVSKEFRAFARHATEPVSQWLRALARHELERCGGPGVGAVGMCFTGGFALGMAVDEHVLAPVLSQPSLPFPVTKKQRADVHLSPADLAVVKQRCDDDDLCVLGLRFTGDRACPPTRFETLRRELGDHFIGVEIDSSPGNAHGIRKGAHSVLTEDLVDVPGHPTHDALNQVLDFFRDRLLPAA
jgi:dienelactone hydrolase